MSESAKTIPGLQSTTSKKLTQRQSSITSHHRLLNDSGTNTLPQKYAATKSAPKNKNAGKSTSKNVSSQHKRKDPTPQKKEKPIYDMEATKKFDSMLRGDLSDLPPLPKTMVKIFISSTFSDMGAERNILAREVYPKLQRFCASRDLDFQAVDMRWGVTEDSINDHSVENLCLLEIENCQKTSVGPNFVVLSGDRYGFRPIPANINVQTFEVLRHESSKLNLPDRNLLDEWYKLDRNSIHKVYVLQPIRTKFTFFGDFSPGCDELREKDTEGWWQTFQALQMLFRKAAEEAFKDNRLSANEKHLYFQSVTESEIQDGILNACDVDLHCLVYKRKLRHLFGVGINDRDTPRYVDVIKSEKGNMLDEEVERLKTSLFEEKIKRKLGYSNIKEYSVHWMPGGVNPEMTEEHRDYIAKFCKDFISDCKRLVLNAEAEKKTQVIKLSDYYTNYDNIVHHLKFCVSKCELFCGQEQILETAKAYILDQSGRKPLVIYAKSGLGKTSIMAMIMKSIPKWLNSTPHLKLIRFLGTTPQCSDIYDVLKDVVGHLSDVYDVIMSPPSYKTMKKLIDFVPRHLRQISNRAKEPIFILLDSIDQLCSKNNAYSMDWLPMFLPQNVKLIVSTLPKEHGILANLKKRLPDRECYVELSDLSEQTGKLMIETYLRMHKRTLTASQMDVLMDVFKKASSPLYLKLLLDESKQWRSYNSKSELELSTSVKIAINKLFQNLESKFGTLLVSRALGYLTIGMSGLTEFEIEDALSSDDEVLNEVYRFHDPPVPGIVQIPPLLWARIWYDIREYLVERMSYGKKTLNWYHREFVLAASERYTRGDKEGHLMKTLFEIFCQENGIKRTISLENRNSLIITDADRQVTPQPYNADNKRKLACLPYHAVRAFKEIGINTAKANVYCNFKFLSAKISAFSVSAVVSDLTEFVEETHDEEVRLILTFIGSSKQDLSNQLRFSFCLLAYINPGENLCQIKSLTKDARDFLELKKRQILIPEFACLAPRQDAASAFQFSVQGISRVLAVSNTTLLLQRPVEMARVSNEEGKSDSNIDIVLWSSDTYELTNIYFSDDTQPVGKYVISDAYLYYITRTTLVRFDFMEDKNETWEFKEIIPDWNPSMRAHNLFTDSLVTLGVLVLDFSVILVSFENFQVMQTFHLSRKGLEIDNVFVLKSGAKLIVTGKIVEKPVEDLQQHSCNKSVVTVYEQDKEVPAHILEFNEKLDCENGVLSHMDQWLVMPAEVSLFDCSEKHDGHDVPEATGQLLSFDVGDSNFTYEKIEMHSRIKSMSVHPEKRRLIVLTITGQVYGILANEFSAVQIQLKFNVNVFTVSWEDEISLFCSAGGKIAMYDHKHDSVRLVFVAHPCEIKDIFSQEQQIITLGDNKVMKVWSVKTLLQDTEAHEMVRGVKRIKETIFDQTSVLALSPSLGGMRLITTHDDGFIKIWSTESLKLLHHHNVGIRADIIHTVLDGLVVLHDTEAGKVKILEITTGAMIIQLPETITNILHSTVNTKKESLFLLSSPRKGKEQVDIVSISRKTFVKTIHLQSGLSYENIEIVLSANERYLVLRQRMSEAYFDHIRELYHQNFPWKKGGFSEQYHRYIFTAVALSEGSGALIPCNRMAKKVRTIGISAQPYRGNVMLISTRRWLVFWDIPTGKCDRKPSKLQKIPMFFRPAWVGRECKGANSVFVQSADQKFVACGSDDGYVFVYSSETGLPVCNRKPSSKHNAEINSVVVSSDSKWIASSCLNSVLKLWDSCTGTEQFSVRLDANVMSMTFSADSRTLILHTGTYTTRILIFSVACGKKSAVKGSKD